jgi:[ribosomal protein S5]-alanine N-acetyltransferase
MLPIIIESERLILRTPLPGDAETFVKALSDRDVVRQTGSVPHPYKRADADAFIAGGSTSAASGRGWTFSIVFEQQVAGTVSLVRVDDVLELGYWIDRAFWGRGLATEAAGRVLDWARQTLHEDSFIAGHFADNPASARVLIKLGFRHVGDADMPSRARDGLSRSHQYTLNAPAAAALNRSHCGHH